MARVQIPSKNIAFQGFSFKKWKLSKNGNSNSKCSNQVSWQYLTVYP